MASTLYFHGGFLRRMVRRRDLRRHVLCELGSRVTLLMPVSWEWWELELDDCDQVDARFRRSRCATSLTPLHQSESHPSNAVRILAPARARNRSVRDTSAPSSRGLACSP